MIRSLFASVLSRAHCVTSAVDDAIVRAWMALTGSPPLTRETLAQALGVRMVEDAPAEIPLHFVPLGRADAVCGASAMNGEVFTHTARPADVTCPDCRDDIASTIDDVEFRRAAINSRGGAS